MVKRTKDDEGEDEGRKWKEKWREGNLVPTGDRGKISGWGVGARACSVLSNAKLVAKYYLGTTSTKRQMTGWRWGSLPRVDRRGLVIVVRGRSRDGSSLLVSGELTVASAHRSKVHPTTSPLQQLVAAVTTTSRIMLQLQRLLLMLPLSAGITLSLLFSLSLTLSLSLYLSVYLSVYLFLFLSVFATRPVVLRRRSLWRLCFSSSDPLSLVLPSHAIPNPCQSSFIFSVTTWRRFSRCTYVHIVRGAAPRRLAERPYHVWKAHPHGLFGAWPRCACVYDSVTRSPWLRRGCTRTRAVFKLSRGPGQFLDLFVLVGTSSILTLDCLAIFFNPFKWIFSLRLTDK